MITSLRLQQFRSYIEASFEFSPGVTVVIGPNASGKTNLLEAIMVLARGTSYRAKDAELVRFNSDWARLDTIVGDEPRSVKLEPQKDVKKTFLINEQPLVRLSLSRTIPSVLFEPNHLLLLSGSPDGRRALLDDLIEQYTPGYASVRRHYKRVLAQRNALLKKRPQSLREQLFVWNVRLSELGGNMALERHKIVQRLDEQVGTLYASLSGGTDMVTLGYATALPLESYETALLANLERNIDVDTLRGFTAYGPHRDDLAVRIKGRPVQDVASRGELRTMVLALKIAELRIIEQARQQKPLLLLDDVFSELDLNRRRFLARFVRPYQTIITTTDADARRQFSGSQVINTA